MQRLILSLSLLKLINTLYYHSKNLEIITHFLSVSLIYKYKDIIRVVINP
jgi:hypothetical protein